MATYVDASLGADERVVYRGGVSWVVYLAPVMMMGFGAAWALSGGGVPGLILVLAGVLAGAGAFIRQATSEFAVTSARVVAKTGLITRSSIEIALSKVESVEVKQDILGRLLNYGSITVSGTGGTHEPFTMIDDPIAFRRAVQQAQN
ncbi:MAG TPA: PH domain-containing protein [Rhizomicrobium sp.]|jgi:uncharacterized membrane protein YdbT with pleckstrin-like domain|nr:PH domain-containing protein [Rhizomicrobium sp.]